MDNHCNQAALEQRRRNVAAIADRRRFKTKCIRGHNNWRIRKDGRRACITCMSDRSWYFKRGLKLV